jgi:hypothetical protein
VSTRSVSTASCHALQLTTSLQTAWNCSHLGFWFHNNSVLTPVAGTMISNSNCLRCSSGVLGEISAVVKSLNQLAMRTANSAFGAQRTNKRHRYILWLQF